MADLQERIWANDANHWHPFPGEEGTDEYVHADLYEALKRKLKEAELRAEAERVAGFIDGQWFPPPAKVEVIDVHPYGTHERIQFLEKALNQAISATALTILTPKEYEDDDGRVHDLPEGLACAHLHLRGIDDYPELAQYLKEKTE